MLRFRLFFFILFVVFTDVQAQDDLLALLGEEEATTEYTKAAFKTTRVINGHSLENVASGVMDIKISHRFGTLNSGAYELWGLDQANIRIGADYGVTERLMIGIGRSNVNKTFDGFLKYKFLRQSTGVKNMPITLAYFGSAAVQTIKNSDNSRENYNSSRWFYTHQLIIGRKFNESFTLQLMPTVVHRNLVETKAEKNDVYSMGMAGRIKLTKRTSLNAEYYYVLPNQLAEGYYNSFAIGFDIETGGHVFQLQFTNSRAMIEKGFITETTGQWSKGDVHFGFNISRVFTLNDPRKRKK